jgi:ankyrin repeat protein
VTRAHFADVIALWEPAAQAARTGRTADLLAILGRGLPASAADGKGDSLVMLAAYHGYADTVVALADRGADIGARNAGGLSPLDGAAFKGDLAIIDALLAAGAAVDEPGPDGRTPLAWAAAFDRDAAVRHLLGRGADPRRVDASGADAAEHARRMGAQRSAAVLAAARRDAQPNRPAAAA